MFDFTKYDNTINSVKRHGCEWSIHDAWFHTNNCFCTFGSHSERNKTFITTRKEGDILSLRGTKGNKQGVERLKREAKVIDLEYDTNI